MGGYVLRMFCIGFTKKRMNQLKKTCYANGSQVKAIRKKMTDIMTAQATSSTLKQLVDKIIPESIGKEIEGVQWRLPAPERLRPQGEDAQEAEVRPDQAA